MKKLIPVILLLQVVLIFFIFLVVTKKKNGFTELTEEDSWYYNPAYKKYFQKLWKRDAAKLEKEMKEHGPYEAAQL